MLDQRSTTRVDSTWGTRTEARGAAAPCGWVVLAPASETRNALLLDEWGTLWWGRVAGDLAAFIRPCSRDEAGEIAGALPPGCRSILRMSLSDPVTSDTAAFWRTA